LQFNIILFKDGEQLMSWRPVCILFVEEKKPRVNYS
jgi:hypothetical protein